MTKISSWVKLFFVFGAILANGQAMDQPPVENDDKVMDEIELNNSNALSLFKSEYDIVAENKSKNLEANVTHYKLRALSNVFQSAQGNKIKPNELRLAITKSTDALKNGWTNSVANYNNGAFDCPLYRSVGVDDTTQVVFLPAHDLPQEADDMKKCASGNLELRKVFETIRDDGFFSQNALTVFIPIAQSNYRNHWVLLVLDKKNKEWEASHLDSKGFSSAWYSLSCVQECLPIIDCHRINYLYLGHQGLKNFNDCGRFVNSYIQHFLKGEDPKDSGTSEIKSLFG